MLLHRYVLSFSLGGRAGFCADLHVSCGGFTSRTEPDVRRVVTKQVV